MANACQPSDWVPTNRLCTGLHISRSTLQKLKSKGHLEPGRHYYRCGFGPKAPCMWDLTECRKTLQSLTAADPQALEVYDLPMGAEP